MPRGTQLLDPAGATTQIGHVVAGVGILDQASTLVDHGIEAGDEHLGRYIRTEHVVGTGQDVAGRHEPLGGRAQQGARRGHHQRGRHAFVGHIGDDDAQAAIFQTQKVIEVAADSTCGLPERGNVPTVQGWHFLGQQGLLDGAGDAQLGFDAFALDRG